MVVSGKNSLFILIAALLAYCPSANAQMPPPIGQEFYMHKECTDSNIALIQYHPDLWIKMVVPFDSESLSLADQWGAELSIKNSQGDEILRQSIAMHTFEISFIGAIQTPINSLATYLNSQDEIYDLTFRMESSNLCFHMALTLNPNVPDMGMLIYPPPQNPPVVVSTFIGSGMMPLTPMATSAPLSINPALDTTPAITENNSNQESANNGGANGSIIYLNQTGSKGSASGSSSSNMVGGCGLIQAQEGSASRSGILFLCLALVGIFYFRRKIGKS